MREWSPGTCLGRTGVASGHCVSGKQLQSGKTPAPVPNLPTPGLLLVKLAQCFLVLQLWDPVPAVLLSRHASTASGCQNTLCCSVGQLLCSCLFLCPRLVGFPIFALQRDATLSEWQSVA